MCVNEGYEKNRWAGSLIDWSIGKAGQDAVKPYIEPSQWPCMAPLRRMFSEFNSRGRVTAL